MFYISWCHQIPWIDKKNSCDVFPYMQFGSARLPRATGGCFSITAGLPGCGCALNWWCAALSQWRIKPLPTLLLLCATVVGTSHDVCWALRPSNQTTRTFAARHHWCCCGPRCACIVAGVFWISFGTVHRFSGSPSPPACLRYPCTPSRSCRPFRSSWIVFSSAVEWESWQQKSKMQTSDSSWSAIRIHYSERKKFDFWSLIVNKCIDLQ